MVSTETLALIFDATATAINGACVITVWMQRRNLAQRSDFVDLKNRVSDLEHGPDWEVLNNVKSELSDVKTSLARIETEVRIRGETLERIDHWLLERGK